MINNFGANTNLFGRMDEVATAPAAALNSPNSGKLKGIGLTMEGISQNPAIYELLTDNTWRNTPIDIEKWLPQYVRNRYGKNSAEALKAWRILHQTVYSVPQARYIRDGAESIIQARPTLDSASRWASTKLNYKAADILPDWKALIGAADDLQQSDGYRFDLVDVTRQVLANYALPLQRKFVADYQRKNLPAFKKHSREFIELIDDMDQLLATRKDFLLGAWIADARRCGQTADEKALYEMNAKDLITLWGDKDCPLNEYACKQWSGLFNDFYKPRWEQFFDALASAIQEKKPFNKNEFIANVKNWEWKWVNTRKDYPVVPKGSSIAQAKRLYSKYWQRVRDAEEL